MKDLFYLTNWTSRSICPENFTGEKGQAAAATEGEGAACARDLGIGWKISPCVSIKAGETFELARVDGSGVISHIWCTDNADMNRQLILRIYWDGNDFPSVEVPACDFFACADYQEPVTLHSLAVCVNPHKGFNCYWQMPFRRGFRVTMENIHTKDVTLYYQIDYQLGEVPAAAAYFHAQFRRVNPLPYKETYTILDGVSGKGQYVGTYLFWGVHNNGWWGEGELKFFLDGDREFPTICSTGTEDYFGGAWDFDVGDHYQRYSSPYSGLAHVTRTDSLNLSQLRFSMYRWHIRDPIYFNRDIRVTMQALGWRSERRYLPLQEDISSVAYFYLENPSSVSGTMPDRDGLEMI